MLTLFFSLYLALFRGTWFSFSFNNIKTMLEGTTNSLGQLVTSLFNNVDTPLTDLGTTLFSGDSSFGIPNYLSLIAFTLALITSIGIVVMAVKGIKRVFSVFFMGIR